MDSKTINGGWAITIDESYFKKLSIQMHNTENEYTVAQSREIYEAIGEFLKEHESCQVMQKSDSEYLEYESLFEGTLQECLDYNPLYVDGWDLVIMINKDITYRATKKGWVKL